MRPFLISALVIAALAAPAVAQSTTEVSSSAAPYLERGLRFYATQQYADALVELRAGYAIDPHPDFLYAIGQAERLSGNCKAASEAYRAYLRTSPPALEASRAQTQIERCEQPPEKPTPGFGTTGYAMSAGSVLALGVGVVFLVAGHQHAAEAAGSRAVRDQEAHRATARNYRIAGGASVVGGAVLGTLAVLRYLRSDRTESKQVTASVGSDHVYVGALVQF
jgi:tetratricopeptide (TPR) repeat protein